MKRKRFSEEQTAFVLKQAGGKTTLKESCRKMRIVNPIVPAREPAIPA